MGDLLMHIGHDKTGSSYLQSLFAKKTSPCLGATAFIIQSHMGREPKALRVRLQAATAGSSMPRAGPSTCSENRANCTC